MAGVRKPKQNRFHARAMEWLLVAEQLEDSDGKLYKYIISYIHDRRISEVVHLHFLTKDVRTVRAAADRAGVRLEVSSLIETMRRAQEAEEANDALSRRFRDS